MDTRFQMWIRHGMFPQYINQSGEYIMVECNEVLVVVGGGGGGVRRSRRSFWRRRWLE